MTSLTLPSAAWTTCSATGRDSSGTAATISSAPIASADGVEDVSVEEVGDLVQLIGQEAAGHDQPGTGGGVLDAAGKGVDGAGVELMGVVDDDRGGAGRLVSQRAEVAAQTEGTRRRCATEQPRLAETDRRLDERDRRRGRVVQAVEQGAAGQADVHASAVTS